MNAQAKPNEPSMEEILASIRRIIADDEVKPAENAAPEPAPVAVEPAAHEDVLDLGAEAALVAAPEPEPQPQPEVSPPEPQDDIDFLDIPEPAPAPVQQVQQAPVAAPIQTFAPPPEYAPAPTPFAAAPFDMAQLLSDQTSSAVTSAFGQLAHTVLSNNARTLEDLVKDMLKPMLKTWLDDNLPTMVERLVRAEIERVARGGRN
jgi:cell pole-organizing protein PopZ